MSRRRTTRRKKKVSSPVALSLILSILLIALTALGLKLREQEIARNEMEERMIETPYYTNTYDWDNVEWDGWFARYEDDNYVSMQGIDVSHHQEQIDWDAVKEAGVEFAMLRCGYRGYETGLIFKDQYFDYNIQEAQKRGILVGVYFYSQAINPEEAREEADFTLKQIEGYTIDLPVVFDMEESETGENGRILSLSREEKTECAVTFLHRVQNAGYTPMVYNSTMLFEELFITEYLQEFDTWVAEYGSYPRYPYEFSMWQYTSSGEVPGVTGECDMDIMLIPKNE
ncbi:MAG: glycoside hydrolase family 25 protein [Solobacterium sp.]|nr:glycoside hydrolase family 25 protein [Solobacterium sp.]MBQ9824311.1 glycoside hydrolase family 25 protein [Solobacterium sp.]